MTDEELIASMRNSSGETLAEVRKRQDDAVAEAFANAEAAGQRKIHTRSILYPTPSAFQADMLSMAFATLGEVWSVTSIRIGMENKGSNVRQRNDIVSQVRAFGCAEVLKGLEQLVETACARMEDNYNARCLIEASARLFGPAKMLSHLSDHISSIGIAAGARQSYVEEKRAKDISSAISSAILEIEQQESLGANNQPPTIAVDKV